MNNVRNIRTDLVTVQDVLDEIGKDLPRIKNIVVVAELDDGELKSGHSTQYASDLALSALLIQDLAIKTATR